MDELSKDAQHTRTGLALQPLLLLAYKLECRSLGLVRVCGLGIDLISVKLG